MYSAGNDCAAQIADQKRDFKNSINPLLQAIVQLKINYEKKTDRPIVAIAGCSGVGKSKFTARLAQILNEEGVKAVIFRMDDFLQPSPFKGLKMHSFAHRNFDPYRLHEVIAKVGEGQSHVAKPIWDHMTWKHSVKIEVDTCYENTDIILFEGTYALCGPDTYDFLKYSQTGFRVFVDAPTECIHEWNWSRDQKGHRPRTKEQYESDVAWDMEDYEKVIHPCKAQADFIVAKDMHHNYSLSLNYIASCTNDKANL